MAGPRYLNVGSVVDPYQGLQQAVSGVGQIYHNYEENERRNAAERRVAVEAERVEGKRRFLAEYDPRLGTDFRGVDQTLRPYAEQEEQRALASWQQQNPNATQEERSAFENQLINSRRGLLSAEDVQAAVLEDARRGGLDLTEAQNLAALQSVGLPSRGSYLASAQAENEARNKAMSERSDRMLELEKLRSAGDNARIRSLGTASTGSGSKNTSGSGGRGDFNLKDHAQFENYVKDQVDGWIGGDADKAFANAYGGLDLYNREVVALGGKPLGLSDIQETVVKNLSRGGTFTDNAALYNTPQEFVSRLVADLGTPEDYVNRSSRTTSGRASAADQISAVLSGRGTLTAAERDLILNPPRSMVDATAVARQRVASAYASLFPEAAARNPNTRNTASETVQVPAPSSSVSSRVEGTVPNQSGRYVVTPPPPLNEGEIRGTRPTVATSTEEVRDNGAGTLPVEERIPSRPEEQASVLANTIFLRERELSLPTPGMSAQQRRQERENLNNALSVLQRTDPAQYEQVQNRLSELRTIDRQIPEITASRIGEVQRDLRQTISRLDRAGRTGYANWYDALNPLAPTGTEARFNLLERQRELQERLRELQEQRAAQLDQIARQRDRLGSLPTAPDRVAELLNNPLYPVSPR